MDIIKRKVKIPFRTIPAPIIWILQNATGQELDYLNRMGKSSDFSIFLNLIGKFKNYNMLELFNYQYTSPEQLVAFKASKVGELAGLDALIAACQKAGIEIAYRKRQKEVRE